MFRAKAALGVLMGTMLLASCTTVRGESDASEGGDKKSSAPHSTPSAVTPPEPSPSVTRVRPPRPSDLQPTPVQDPCALMSESRAREITGNSKLSRYDDGPYYLPDSWRPNEPANWICRYGLHKFKPVEGLMFKTYDTTNSAHARRKYDEVVSYDKSEKYYKVETPSKLRIKGAEQAALLAFSSKEYEGYGGIVIRSRNTVVTISWTTPTISVLKRLAEEVAAATATSGK